MNDRKAFDLDSYIEHIQNSPCFICEMIAGRLNGNHIIFQNNEFIAFLNKYPTLYGYALVAPIVHTEQVTGDITLDEYISLQRAIYQVTEAIRQTVDAERVYILSQPAGEPPCPLAYCSPAARCSVQAATTGSAERGKWNP